MIPESYREAHEAADYVWGDVEQLMKALIVVAEAAVAHDPTRALIRTIEEKVCKAIELQQAAFDVLQGHLAAGGQA